MQKNKVDDSICIYDNEIRKSSQNVHIIPKEEKVLKSLNTIIGNLKELTIHQLVEHLNCEKIDTEEDFIKKKQEKDNKCYIWDGNNGKISIPSECADTLKEYLEKVRLYMYIPLMINGNKYELNFMRFFIEDNRIHCILSCPQFDRCIGTYVNENGICYPHTPDSEKGQLKNIISVTETHFGMNNYCYNPGIEGLCIEKLSAEDGSAYFKDYACLLAEEFIEFINENESINVKNKEKYNLFLDGAKIPFYDYNQNEVTKKILDVSLGNYHLAPKNSYLKDCVAKAIFNNLVAIEDHIKKKDKKILYENEGIIFNKGQHVLRKSTTYEQIYSYIRIQTEKYYYDLMGFRMGKDDDSCISCKLKSYQFICADKNTFKGNTQKFKSWQVYPGSLEDGVETLPSMKNPCKNFPDAIVFYHNPKTKFISKNDLNKEEWNKSIEEIVKEFLDFIKVNEGA